MLLVDSWTDIRNAVITYGICWIHTLWKSSTDLADFFNKVEFIHSITAFNWGQKDVVRVFSIWRDCIRFWKSLDSKIRPRSVWMFTGTPKQLIYCSTSALEVISVVWSGNGTASYHFVKWSPNNAMYGLPFEIESGPRKSIPIWAKGKLRGRMTKLCLCFCSGLLLCWQTKRLESKTTTSVFWPGQKNLVRIFFRVVVTPGWTTVVEL